MATSKEASYVIRLDSGIKMHLFPSLSLAGKTVIGVQAVLLALDHNASKPSQNDSFQWSILDLLPITVAGPRRFFTDFSIKPLRAPVPIFCFSFCFVLDSNAIINV
jgi:hypothetical protein